MPTAKYAITRAGNARCRCSLRPVSTITSSTTSGANTRVNSQLHKRRNVGDHLPKSQRETVDARLRGAFADPDPEAGLRKAKALAAELDKSHPDAAGSLREGLEEMFTVRRMGIDGTLARTLVCTNMIESMISIARTMTRNVKRWRNEGDMRRRWCAAGLLEAERKFRRVRGHKQPPEVAPV